MPTIVTILFVALAASLCFNGWLVSEVARLKRYTRERQW